MTDNASLDRLLNGDIVASRLGEIFETIDQGITLYDKDYRLILWNKQYEALEITPAKFLHYGSSLLDTYIHAAVHGTFGVGDPVVIARKRMSDLAAGDVVDTELLTPPTGTLIRIRRFKTKEGGFFATFRDVTDQMRQEQQQRQTAKMDAIGQLTGGMAHDLNNLLSIILGNLDMALETGGKDNPFLHKAVDAVERGSGFVQRLLAFARQQPLEPTLTDVGKLLAQFLPLFPPMLGERIQIDLRKPPEAFICHIDPNQLETVIMNLVVNAKDAIEGKGVISISLDNMVIQGEQARSLEIPPGPYVKICVTDDGCGMTPRTVANAFEPFFTTKPPGFGTGLGLSMAMGFCQQSGGAIEVDSAVGSGTTVRLYTPCAQRKLHEQGIADKR